MQPNSVRLSRPHEAWLYATAGLLFATGLLWLGFHYFIKVQGEFGPAPHPLETWWMKLHGAASFAWLFLLGSVALWHSWRAWMAGRNRASGASFAAANLLLAVTGYLLYYAGGEQFRGYLSILHWATGIACPALFVWHVVEGKLSRNAG